MPLTMLEILRKKGFTESQINAFYKKRERLGKMNINFTIKDLELEEYVLNYLEG